LPDAEPPVASRRGVDRPNPADENGVTHSDGAQAAVTGAVTLGADGAANASTGFAVLLLVCGGPGLLASMVLTIDRIRLLQDPSTQLGCNLSPFIACGPVMQSRAGALFGFPNPLLGIIGFTVVVTTAMVLLAGARLRRWYWVGLQVGVVAAAVFITWLQSQSLYVIHALCLWCMLVWTVTIPTVVAVTVRNLAAGSLGRWGVTAGERVRHYQVSIVAVWYLIVIAAIGLRFYREFALYWFGVALR
jgi:uncharacterized membrane protein